MSDTLKPLSFALSVPIGSWNPALPTVLQSLSIQDVPLKLAVLDASGDARVAEAVKASGLSIAYERVGPDTGQSAAIQEGWNALEADVYGWLNADDFLYPNTLKDITAIFQNDSEIDVVTGHGMLVTPDFSPMGLHPGVQPPSELLMLSNIICQPSTFVRHAALKAAGPVREDLHYTMDWDLWMRLWQQGSKFKFLDQCLSGIVVDDQTKTSQFNKRRQQEILMLVEAHHGKFAALKALFGFGIYHLAQKKNSGRLFAPIYRRLRHTAPHSATSDTTPWALAGLPIKQEAHWPITHLQAQPISNIRLECTAPIEVWSERAAKWVSLSAPQSTPYTLAFAETRILRTRPKKNSSQIEKIDLIIQA